MTRSELSYQLDQQVGYKESNPKIDIYVDGKYKCSSNWYRTNKQAIAVYHHNSQISISRITAKRSN